jgi:hypothetical protein
MVFALSKRQAAHVADIADLKSSYQETVSGGTLFPNGSDWRFVQELLYWSFCVCRRLDRRGIEIDIIFCSQNATL